MKYKLLRYTHVDVVIIIIVMKNYNDFQVHRCIECMRELEAVKNQGSSRLQTSLGRSCFQCKQNIV